MPIPNHQDLMLPLLELLADGREWMMGELTTELALKLDLTKAELDERFKISGRPLFETRARWALRHLHKAGLVEKVRKTEWRITQRGRDVLAQRPERIDTRLVLIDGERLVDLMIEYGLGVSTVVSYELKRIDYDFFAEE